MFYEGYPAPALQLSFMLPPLTPGLHTGTLALRLGIASADDDTNFHFMEPTTRVLGGISGNVLVDLNVTVTSSCGLTQPDIVLDHGTVSSRDITTSVASARLSVQCDADTTVYLTIKEPVVKMTNGLESRLTWPDGITRQEIKAVAGVPTSVPLQSALQTTGTIAAGTYSGSTVVELSFQ
ncbi:hypothetical protein M2422_004472 [Enterobacter sp. SLBN-59]|nr:hypothetical protein [Enterobacter sp. SLBN-59]